MGRGLDQEHGLDQGLVQDSSSDHTAPFGYIGGEVS